MIKFFRRIRQRLLSKNKFSKYLFYALGEIILVVIGILIALQINNWNEQRKNDNEVRTLTKSMITDLQSDIDYFELSLIRNDSIFTDFATINAIVLSGDTTKDLKKPVLGLLRYYTFRPNNATYKSVVSNNFLGKFDNATEKEIIGYYEYSYNRLIDNTIGQSKQVDKVYDVFTNELPSCYSTDKVYNT